ncbi:MAG: hypothetical protein AAB347_02125, partial [Bacteroidota bacterium]
DINNLHRKHHKIKMEDELKVILTIFSFCISCLMTPSVVLRIVPILLLRPQEAQPGIFSCTILSAA